MSEIASNESLLADVANLPVEQDMDSGVVPMDDPNLMQWITRRLNQELDTYVGNFRCVFLPGQQRYTLHCVFHPVFDLLPEIEAYCMEDEDVRVRITNTAKFGVRAEVVLSEPAASRRSVLVELIAAAPVDPSNSPS